MGAEVAVFNEFRAQLSELKIANSSLIFDYEDAEGNKEARSHVYKLRKAKSAVEKARKDEKQASLDYGRKVDAEANEIRVELESMIDVHQKPLDEIEEKEKARLDRIVRAIEEMRLLSSDGNSGATSEALKKNLATVKDVNEASFGEHAEMATDVKTAAIANLTRMIADAEKREAELVELAELRRQKVEQEQKDRDEKIRKEAAEKAAADEKAKADAALKKAQDDAIAQANAVKAAADAKERALIAEKEKAEREKQEAIDKAAREKKETEAKAARAVEEERERVAKAKAAKDAEDAKREANTRHRNHVRGKITAALSELAISPDQAAAIIEAIDAGKIPGVKITY